LNQRYAMVVESNRIEIDHSLNIDFVFSENAFKIRLYLKQHPGKAFWEAFGNSPKRSADIVARKADRPQIYIDSQRDTVDVFFIEKISDTKK